jgi:hypothetical protein
LSGKKYEGDRGSPEISHTANKPIFLTTRFSSENGNNIRKARSVIRLLTIDEASVTGVEGTANEGFTMTLKRVHD